jgi:N-acetylmuramoyl-L-alanine amidase
LLKVVKIIFISILLILLTGQNGLALEKKPTSVILGERELNPEVKCIEKEDVLYINHHLLEEVFKSEVKWELAKGQIIINLENYKIQFQATRSLVILNGKKYKLNHPPFEEENILWLPLEFYLLLGITESGGNDRQIKLAWEENYLLNLNLVRFQGRPALELYLSDAIGFKDFLLTKPGRLVCQLPATKVHPVALSKLNHLRNGLIKKVSFNRDDDGLLTLVFDLSESPGYQVFPDPDLPERVLIVFNYFVEDLSLFHQGKEVRLNIDTSSPANYKVIKNDFPNFTVELQNAVLKTEKRKIPGDGELIKEILIEQTEPDEVRLDLVLLKREDLYVNPAPDNPNQIQIRNVQLITGLEWLDSGQESQLVITGDGEILAKAEKLKKHRRIKLDLDYAQFQTGITIPQISGQGKAIRISALNSHQVRVEIDLNYYFGHDLEFSANRRQLRLVLKESPLLNRTFVLDPGHGGIDNGASGKNGTLEKELNLEVSLRLKDLLEEAGANVVLTRFEDKYISLYERAFIANFIMADYFISIHTNSHPKSQINGVEIFYYSGRPKAKPMAARILDAITGRTGLNKLAVKTNNFVVIRETQMTGILLELGFLSNQQEEQIISTDNYKDNAAHGIFDGIIDYFQ